MAAMNPATAIAAALAAQQQGLAGTPGFTPTQAQLSGGGTDAQIAGALDKVQSPQLAYPNAITAMPFGAGARFMMPHGVPNMNNSKLAWREYSASLPGAVKVQNPNTIPGGAGGGPGTGPGTGGGGGTGPTPGGGGGTTPITNPVTNPPLPVGTMPGNNGASLIGANQNNYAAKLIAAQGAPKTQEAQNNLGSELANQMMAVGRPPAGGYRDPNITSTGNILAAVRLAQQAGTFNGDPLAAYAQYKDQLNLPTDPNTPWDPTASGGG